MKNSVKKLQVLAMFLVAALFSFVYAQNITGKSVKIEVNGTSPMHNWKMNSSSGTFSGNVAGNVISDVKFTTATKSLKSEKGKIMDNKAYDALKADKNPNISFAVNTIQIGKSILNGKLTVAGVTKNVVVPVVVTKTGAAYKITGESHLKMSDFGMQTPGFMGIRTGDAVVVKIDIVAN